MGRDEDATLENDTTWKGSEDASKSKRKNNRYKGIATYAAVPSAEDAHNTSASCSLGSSTGVEGAYNSNNHRRMLHKQGLYQTNSANRGPQEQKTWVEAGYQGQPNSNLYGGPKNGNREIAFHQRSRLSNSKSSANWAKSELSSSVGFKEDAGTRRSKKDFSGAPQKAQASHDKSRTNKGWDQPYDAASKTQGFKDGIHLENKGQRIIQVDNWGMRNKGWQPENKWERNQSRGMWQSHKPETNSETINVNLNRDNRLIPPPAQGFRWRNKVNNSVTGSGKDSASHEAAEASHVRNGALPNLLPSEQYQALSMLDDDIGSYQSGSDFDAQSIESDDELLGSGDDDDSDASDVSHETQKKNKWFRKFFHSLDCLTIEEVNDSSRQWHCPACHGGVGAIDWYKGMQPLISHAKTIRSKRVRLHRKLAKVLEEELNRRGAAGLNAEGMFGKWKGLGEVTNNQEIVWPPMVIIQNTLLEQDDKEMWLGMGNKELLEYFKGYKAMKAKHAYGPKGHRGMSVLIFESSAMGYLEAERLHKHFVKEGRGKDDWDRCHVQFQPGGKRVLYGHIATKEYIEIFNKHSKGKARLKHDMRSYQLMVVEPMKKMNEDNQKLIWTKNKAAKEQEHNKILEEAVGIVGRKLRIKENEIKIIRQRATEQHEESTREMNYLEESYRKELQQLSEDITRREQELEKMQEDFKKEYMDRCHQLEVDCVNLPQDMKIGKDEQEEQSRIREEIATIVELSIKETEEYERERQELIKDHDSRRKEFKMKQLCEEVSFEKECEQERFHMLDKFSKRRQEAEHCIN